MTGSAKSNARILAGECFCRAVGYAVADEFAYAMNCHCSNCRRTTGAAFKPFAGIARDKLSVTRGADNLMILWRRGEPRRALRAMRLVALFGGA